MEPGPAVEADDPPPYGLPGSDAGRFDVRPVDTVTWPDMRALFTARGGPRYCWCMAWRATGAELKLTDNASRERALRDRVERGLPVGILAYVDGSPVAWCSIAPRDTYRRLGGADLLGDQDRIWSLVCFYTQRAWRRHGLTQRLVQEAVEYARRHGATAVEAYPVDPDSPSYQYMGHVDTFAKAGSKRWAGRGVGAT